LLIEMKHGPDLPAHLDNTRHIRRRSRHGCDRQARNYLRHKKKWQRETAGRYPEHQQFVLSPLIRRRRQRARQNLRALAKDLFPVFGRRHFPSHTVAGSFNG
jgi:hypothetical protein